ncbi:MAG TPA: SBBP repeat-containing protein [Pyrinomonadaceae bacterium]|nr:SBBP repeat-containing protein [Pyrinomonadaceae bacterium]
MRSTFNQRNFVRAVFFNLLVVTALFAVISQRLMRSVLAVSVDTASTSSSEGAGKTKARVDGYGNLPLSFERNVGQTAAEVKFLARGQGYGLFLTSNSAVLRLRKTEPAVNSKNESEPEIAQAQSASLSLRFRGARAVSNPLPLLEQSGKANYFIGNNPRKSLTNVQSFAKVRYPEIYPGIDVVYYGNQRQLEYDLVLAPGASAERISIGFEGARDLKVDPAGNLVLSSGVGDIRQLKPVAYQNIDGSRHEIAANYKLDGNNVRIEVGAYDRRLPLIIDPTLAYSTFLGGTSLDQGTAIAVDSQGNAYLTGVTQSTDFPTASALQGAKDAVGDAFVAKLNPAGTALVYSTYLGGNGDDAGNGIAVDSQGNAYVTGLTGSGSFPVTPGGFQDMKDGSLDSFLTKLNASGSALVYSTFIGGDNNETTFGVAVDSNNRAYVVGRTDSTRFRTLPFSTPRRGSAIYRSGDATAHWTPSASGLTASIVNSLTQDPVSASTIYAGTTIGVFKSTDGGTNWTITGSNPPVGASLATSAVVVDPSNPNTIYVATSTLGVYKSTNGGTSYVQKNVGLGTTFVLSLAIDPNSPQILYAGTSFGAFKSTDGGENWASINNGTNSARINKIVIDPSQNPATTIYAATQSRGMLKSTNGGALWSQINSGLQSSAQIQTVTLDPANPSTMYAGVNGLSDPLYKTTNGGGSWSPSGNGMLFTFAGQPALPLVTSLIVDPSNSFNLYASTLGGAIYKSTNAGANWSQSNSGFNNANANVIAIDRTNNANLFTGTSIGNDAFAMRFSPAGSFEYLLTFGGDESDEARGVAVDGSGNAYVTGFTNSNNLAVVNAFQSTFGGASDAFVGKINSAGSGFNYLTYLGGNASDLGRGIAVRNGEAYITGSTTSANFPLANALKSTLTNFDTDGFVTKLNTAGSGLSFSTYLGGQATDQGLAIAVDSTGSAYVTGTTSSADFPIKSAPQPTPGAFPEAFVTKLTPAGTAINYATFLGGTGNDQGNGIAVDSPGNAYVIGNTASSNFPTAGPLQSYRGSTDAFVTKLAAAADLVVTMTGSPGSVIFHNQLTYNIAVSNTGEIPAENVQLTDTLLSGAGVLSMSTTRGSCSGNHVITCNLLTLEPGATATVTVIVLPPAQMPMTSTAVATSTTPDANLANNTSTLNTPVFFTDLKLQKTSALKFSEVGGIDTYIITVTNLGPLDALTITVTDNLPAETTFVSCRATNSAVCGGSGNNRTATISSLAVGASFTAAIAVQINSNVSPGTVISNTASMTSAIPDINPNNDAQTATTTTKAASAPAQNGLIAFSARDTSITSGETDIWLTNADGTGQKDISFEVSLDDYQPAWSPDGTRIAYAANPGGIYVMNADGSNKTQLTTFAIDTTPTWSPDGTRIAFGSVRGPGAFGVYIMNSDGSNQKRLTDGNVPAWSPDGTRIAFSRGSGIELIYVDGGGRSSLSLPRVALPGFGWSPDSSKIAFAMQDNSPSGQSIYTINADGTGGVVLVNNTSGGGAPSWSPDGTKLAFSLSPSAGVDAGIYTSNVDGSGRTRISGPVVDGFTPNWQRQPPNFTPLPPTFTISGQVTNAANGTSVPASINVTGSLTRTFSADNNGNYVIKGLAQGGNYTLTPSIFGTATSDPPNRQFNNLSANQTGANFALTFPPRQPITGFVTNHLGAPLAGVRVGLRNSFPETDVFTDSNGFYTFGSAIPGAQPFVLCFNDGSYTNYVFEPPTLSVQNPNNNNFVGRPKTASISGTVTVGGVGKAGVQLFTGSPQFMQTTTDGNGNYTFAGVGEGVTLTVQVDQHTYPFLPKTQTVIANGAVTGVNFAAPLNQYVIYGQVTSVNSSSPLAGVTLTLTEGGTATTQTDSQGRYSLGPLPGGVRYVVAATKPGFSCVPFTFAVPNLSSNNEVNITAYENTVQVYSDFRNVTVPENGGTASITIVRTGLLTETVKVDYVTSDVTASQRSDYTPTLGTLTFGPQEQAKTIVIPVSDDSLVEGDESFKLTLTNPIGGLIGTIGSATITIEDDDTATPTVNPLDSGAFFARQHYLDFLNRVPDSSGLQFWTEQITDCGIDSACLEIRRINVSAAFFLSIEFQETGYLVERIYKSAYGDAIGTSNFGPTHQLPVPIIRLNEFLPDTQQIGRGVVVGVGNWQAQLEANKVAFTQDFVSRSRFTGAYANSLTPTEFVDALFVKAGVTPLASDRTAAINEFGGAGNTSDIPARARALRRVAENSILNQQEKNRAFVLMQYFGYLRRNPNDPQDTDYTGYDFWLTKLNEFNGNFVNADMVKAFIVSTEYRHRFGP